MMLSSVVSTSWASKMGALTRTSGSPGDTPGRPARRARRPAIITLLQRTTGEKVTTMLPLPKEGDNYSLIMATKGGYIKKTDLDEFRNLRRMGLYAVTLMEGDELVGVRLCRDGDTLLMGTREGRAIRCSTGA